MLSHIHYITTSAVGKDPTGPAPRYKRAKEAEYCSPVGVIVGSSTSDSGPPARQPAALSRRDAWG